MGYKYKRLVKLPVQEVIGMMNENGSLIKFIHEGKSYSISISNRLRTFTKGISCVHCGLEGHFFWVEKQAGPRWHLNLYHQKRSGQLVMITSDHIVPRALGGTSYLENLQPMCRCCNQLKGEYSSVEEAIAAKEGRTLNSNSPEFQIRKLEKWYSTFEHAKERWALGDTSKRWDRIISEAERGFRKLLKHLKHNEVEIPQYLAEG